ncbi:MAG: pre-peptidase C-terminal domain-containing protein [Pleurocapsa sp.]
MDLFANQWNSNLGSVGRTPTETSLYLEEGTYENDVYQFEVEEAGDLNISLTSTPGDDADLELYRDSNDNGYLDAEDELIVGSYNEADAVDTVELEGATEDTYFTRVSYYNGGEDSYLNYDLSLYTEDSDEGGDLFENQYNYDIGYVGRTPYETSLYLEQGTYENDVYQFSLDEAGDLDVSLHNLSAGDDADLQLYRDSNSNGVLDANYDLLDGSHNGGDVEDYVRYADAAAGGYFARVNYFYGGDDGIIDYNLSLVSEEPTVENLFNHQYNYELDNIDRNTVERSTYLSQGTFENDVYQFSVSETSNLDLSLSSLDETDDADLQLYRDSNDDGVLDAGDELISGSYAFAGSNDVIDYDQAAAGTYFARVNYVNGGGDSNIDYDLSVSADTYVNDNNRFEYQSNLDLGTIGRTATETSLYLEQGIYENDVYQLTLEETGDLDISLYNLSAGDDADLQLYRDVNNNYILDADDEWIDASVNNGDVDDYIRYEDAATGTYFANVSYYNGGEDGFIDYSLSASAELDETSDNGDTAGQVFTGDAEHNTFTGTEYNDTITGGAGNDYLTGGAGDDYLVGSNANALGSGEYDVVAGGEGADTFVIGDSVQAYYQDHAYSDYVSITDFNWAEGDKIVAYGVAEDYHTSEYNGGTEIYYQGDLVAHTENTTDVIVSFDFTFV